MNISRIRALRGPNLWTRRTAIEAIVGCDDAERSVDDLPGFEARLRARFPEIGPLHPLGHSESGSIAHVLAGAALALQAQAGCPVSFVQTTPTPDPGVYQVVVEYTEESVGRFALELAEALCRSALADTGFDLGDALARLREMDEELRMGPSTGSIVQAAVARAASRTGGSPTAAWCSSVGAAANDACRRPRSTPPARSQSRSRRTRS